MESLSLWPNQRLKSDAPYVAPLSRAVIQIHMNPEIYTSKEISFIKSLMRKFREIITDDESLFGFSLKDFDVVSNKFPDVDIYDESQTGCDDSWIVLNNMFLFLLDNNPKTVLKTNEFQIVKNLLNKLKNV